MNSELAQAKGRIAELERLVAKLRARSGHDDYGGRVCGSFLPGKSCDCGWDEIEKELPVLPPLKEHGIVRLLSDFRFNDGGTARTIPAGAIGAVVSVLPRDKFTVEFLARSQDGFSCHTVVELDRTQLELDSAYVQHAKSDAALHESEADRVSRLRRGEWHDYHEYLEAVRLRTGKEPQ